MCSSNLTWCNKFALWLEVGMGQSWKDWGSFEMHFPLPIQDEDNDGYGVGLQVAYLNAPNIWQRIFFSCAWDKLDWGDPWTLIWPIKDGFSSSPCQIKTSVSNSILLLAFKGWYKSQDSLSRPWRLYQAEQYQSLLEQSQLTFAYRWQSVFVSTHWLILRRGTVQYNTVSLVSPGWLALIGMYFMAGFSVGIRQLGAP